MEAISLECTLQAWLAFFSEHYSAMITDVNVCFIIPTVCLEWLKISTLTASRDWWNPRQLWWVIYELHFRRMVVSFFYRRVCSNNFHPKWRLLWWKHTNGNAFDTFSTLTELMMWIVWFRVEFNNGINFAEKLSLAKSCLQFKWNWIYEIIVRCRWLSIRDEI